MRRVYRPTRSTPESPAPLAAGPLSVDVEVVEAARVLGAMVVDREGQPLGHIHDLVLDADLGVVAYVLVHVTAEAGEIQEMALAWESLRRDGAAGSWSCDVDGTAWRTVPRRRATPATAEDLDWLEHRTERFGR